MKRAGVCRNIIKYTRVYRQGLFYVAINIRQTAAPKERHISNARLGVWNINGGQTTATIERTISNARHGVGNSDGGQACAARERRISNARHGVGDGDGGQTSATKVFATYCVPICFD